MNPAVEYLESTVYAMLMKQGRHYPTMHRSEYEEATVLTSGGVTAERPMFELIDDHETNEEGKCWRCKDE